MTRSASCVQDHASAAPRKPKLLHAWTHIRHAELELEKGSVLVRFILRSRSPKCVPRVVTCVLRVELCMVVVIFFQGCVVQSGCDACTFINTVEEVWHPLFLKKKTGDG
jgi:hypothetical protein